MQRSCCQPVLEASSHNHAPPRSQNTGKLEVAAPTGPAPTWRVGEDVRGDPSHPASGERLVSVAQREFGMALIGFGPVEAIVVVIVVLVVFGAGRLAGVGKALGTGLREFREEARTGNPEDEDGEAEDEVAVSSSNEDERSSSGR